MILLALEALATSRAQNEASGKPPPYVTHLRPKRAARLKAELASLGAGFAVPIGGFVPSPREPEDEWIYLGIVLADVHVYERT